MNRKYKWALMYLAFLEAKHLKSKGYFPKTKTKRLTSQIHNRLKSSIQSDYQEFSILLTYSDVAYHITLKGYPYFNKIPLIRYTKYEVKDNKLILSKYESTTVIFDCDNRFSFYAKIISMATNLDSIPKMIEEQIVCDTSDYY